MKSFSLLILLWFVHPHNYAQTEGSPGYDCNPRLNEQEIAYLSNMFTSDNFDFKGKTIGFAAHHVKKICKWQTIDLSGSWPIDKKQYFAALAEDSCKTTVSKLLVLNEGQKKETKGFDAIVLIYPKKKEKKIDAKKIDLVIEVFGYRTLNYPDNLDLVGNDNSNELSKEEEAFFNQIYHDRGFDFKGKKVAFMNPHLVDEKQAIRTKKEYIEKIRKHLENDFLYPTDELAILNEEEKKESGGYDAMIIYQTKKSNVGQLIKILKEQSQE